MLPKRVREKIKAVRKDFDEVFILAESPKMKIHSAIEPAPIIAPGDPLVIGWKKGIAPHGTFFLIDKFDTTSVEQYVADEFSVK